MAFLWQKIFSPINKNSYSTVVILQYTYFWQLLRIVKLFWVPIFFLMFSQIECLFGAFFIVRLKF